jgi:hypothetical protein
VAALAGPSAVVAEPLGADPELASLVTDRYLAAVAPVMQYA